MNASDMTHGLKSMGGSMQGGIVAIVLLTVVICMIGFWLYNKKQDENRNHI